MLREINHEKRSILTGSFLLETILGAVVALLFAPRSGEELRAQIRNEAQLERERLATQYEKGRQNLQNQVEKAKADVESRWRHGNSQPEETVESV